MEIYVLNTNFESVAVVDEFESLIWTDRYDEAGDFELYMSMDKRLLEYLRKDYYLWNADSEHMMIIEGINTNLEFMHLLTYHPDFIKGSYNTGFWEKNHETIDKWMEEGIKEA